MPICTKCGESKPQDCFYFRQNRGYYYSQCKVCHGSFDKPKSFSNSWYKERFSVEELALFSVLKNTCTKAKLRNREFDLNITWEYLFELWEEQNGLCAYSGLPLSIEVNHPHKVSLDRINSKLGYIIGNLQLASSSVNRMKQEFDEDFFVDVCKRIAEKHS